MTLPDHVTLCGIQYRVQASEGLVVFTATDGCWGCHTRMVFHPDSEGACWYMSFKDSGGSVMASHIVSAYKVVCEHYGKNHEIHWGKG